MNLLVSCLVSFLSCMPNGVTAASPLDCRRGEELDVLLDSVTYPAFGRKAAAAAAGPCWSSSIFCVFQYRSIRSKFSFFSLTLCFWRSSRNHSSLANTVDVDSWKEIYIISTLPRSDVGTKTRAIHIAAMAACYLTRLFPFLPMTFLHFL